ncbi:MAG TPA: hypothetical protein VFN83_11335 [Gemmatimonadales bacterium]|nr:hypothetical protein [Gemmatimonadales bacterium]
MTRTIAALCLVLSAAACQPAEKRTQAAEPPTTSDSLLAKYDTVRLTADLSQLKDAGRQMLPLLIAAAQQMDSIYWLEVSGPADSVLGSIADPDLKRFAAINYGPWDKLDGDKPFVPGVGPKPEGARFYPADMTKAQFDSAVAASRDHGAALKGLYTLVRRDSTGALVTVPYHEAFRGPTARAAALLRQASALAPDPGMKKYLSLRATALETDNYQPSDYAWLDMKNNGLDLVIGPIETYEDALFGYKAAHEAYVLVKDREWSARLARFAKVLPALQRGLPVEAKYKAERPGTDSDLNAYDAVFYAGQANAGGKTIAINLPNDEQVQLKKGTRRLQLKNAMKAKFDRILVPIADRLIAPDQRANISFDAFFQNTMFHEVAHGLGIKNTINGRGTVRAALKEQAGQLEEGKADVLGLYMIGALAQSGDLPGAKLNDNYVTFLASIFRSVRFGAADAHGRANVARFNFFKELGAFSRDSATGTYRANPDRMKLATDSLSATILRFQGNGDYDGVVAFMQKYGSIDPVLQGDLDRLSSAGIPVDVVFDQGPAVLGIPAAAP